MNKLFFQKFKGLPNREAANRLKLEGYNEIPSAKKRSFLKIVIDVVTEPMLLLLLSGGFLYLLIGDTQEALMLLGFVLVVIGITLYQENKTERALEALRDLSSPRALVIRDGEQKRIAGRELVREDIIILSEGDRIPADGVILENSYLLVDESLLTGESFPVRKVTWNGKSNIGDPGGHDLPSIYSGTLIVQGSAIAKVMAIGTDTQIGKIGKSLKSITTEKTLLQKEITKLVRNFAVLGLFLSLIVIIVYALTKGSWPQAILSGITLAMAMLPEEFPVVLTVFLAMGAWRIAKKNVLTRRVSALESLGSTTVLCVDKTGTITLNKMSVTKIFAEDEFYDLDQKIGKPLPEKFHEIVEFAMLASPKNPFEPIEKAIQNLANITLSKTGHLHENWQLEKEYPLSKNLLSHCQVWKSPDGKKFIIAASGAPETIADLCHYTKKQQQKLAKEINLMAKEGLRIVGVAKAFFKKTNLPLKQHDFNFEVLGFFGLTDPVRPNVPAAVKECYQAGIRVVMLTGDYPQTAQNIARKIGLLNPEKYITGQELQKMTENQLAQHIKSVNIFARIMPEQKLMLVKALKRNGEIVTMTGDGVNDAPALKASHIGVAMGQRGTDVAREASSLVLVNDDFSSIVVAIKLGRGIFDNLKKAMSYILAIHVPIAGMSLAPFFLQWPLILFPVHIAFLELIIDPACSIIFETEPIESSVMNRPPRDPEKPLFGKQAIILSFLQGLGVLLFVLFIYSIALRQGKPEKLARTLAFATLVIANIGLILTNRSWSKTILGTFKTQNKAFWGILLGTLSVLAVTLYFPLFQRLFHFTSLNKEELLIPLIVGFLSILWFELLKFFNSSNIFRKNK